MTDFKAIYNTQAGRYDELVAHEDYEGNILPALNQVRPLAGLDVVELGAGTGRLTRLLAPLVRAVYAFDISPHMLAVARLTLQAQGCANWATGVADNRHLPLAAGAADVAMAGWSLGHFVGWYPRQWRVEIGQALAVMKRVLRPGGTVIILETQGTGRETPQPPTAGLAAYYAWLEKEHGFTSAWIRTDYQFASAAQASSLIRFFFGDELADDLARRNTRTVPECTGVWWLTL
jgi:ubiquinone/menaquinone biosynthesis C-methylase UbiE